MHVTNLRNPARETIRCHACGACRLAATVTTSQRGISLPTGDVPSEVSASVYSNWWGANGVRAGTLHASRSSPAILTFDHYAIKARPTQDYSKLAIGHRTAARRQALATTNNGQGDSMRKHLRGRTIGHIREAQTCAVCHIFHRSLPVVLWSGVSAFGGSHEHNNSLVSRLTLEPIEGMLDRMAPAYCFPPRAYDVERSSALGYWPDAHGRVRRD
jgi:hypothetical protein